MFFVFLHIFLSTIIVTNVQLVNKRLTGINLSIHYYVKTKHLETKLWYKFVIEQVGDDAYYLHFQGLLVRLGSCLRQLLRYLEDYYWHQTSQHQMILNYWLLPCGWILQMFGLLKQTGFFVLILFCMLLTWWKKWIEMMFNVTWKRIYLFVSRSAFHYQYKTMQLT